MATNRRLTVAVMAAALLSACAPDDAERTQKLEAANHALGARIAALEQQLHDQHAVRQAELEYLERQASIAAGCDFLLPMYPASITAPGHKARSEGLGGGAGWPFWLAVILKLAGLGGLLTGSVAAWYWLVAPQRKTTTAAQAAIQDVQKNVEDAKKTAAMHEDKALDAKRRTEETLAELENTRQAIRNARHELAKIESDRQSAEAAKDALSCF